MVDAEPERGGGTRQVIVAELVGLRDEGGVAGVGDGSTQCDVAEGAARVVVVVLEGPAVDSHRRRARHHGVRREPGAQQGQAADGLERRPRGELTVGRVVVAVGARPVGRDQDRPGRGPDRHQRAARPDVRERVLGDGLQMFVHGQLQRGPRLGVHPEQLTLLTIAGDRVDHRAVDALQLVVVARLQPGEPGLVADLVLVRVLLDHLCRDRSDRAEDRCSEPAGRRERQVVGDRECTRDVVVPLRDGDRQVVLAEDDRLDERLVSGGLDLLLVRPRLDVDQLGQPASGLPRLVRRDLRAVDPEADDGSQGHQGQPVRAHDRPPGAGDRSDVEDGPRAEGRLHELARPRDLPLVVGLGQLCVGRVGPLATPDRPGPGERGGRGVAVRLHVARLHGRVDVRAHALDDLPVLQCHRLRGVVGEGDVAEVAGAERRREALRGLVGVGSGDLLRRVACAEHRGPEDESGGEAGESAHAPGSIRSHRPVSAWCGASSARPSRDHRGGRRSRGRAR